MASAGLGSGLVSAGFDWGFDRGLVERLGFLGAGAGAASGGLASPAGSTSVLIFQAGDLAAADCAGATCLSEASAIAWASGPLIRTIATPPSAVPVATPAMVAVRTAREKLITYPQSDAPDEVYDLAADPAESRNLAREQPARRKALHRRLRQLQDATGLLSHPAYGEAQRDAELAPVPKGAGPRYTGDQPG